MKSVSGKKLQAVADNYRSATVLLAILFIFLQGYAILVLLIAYVVHVFI